MEGFSPRNQTGGRHTRLALTPGTGNSTPGSVVPPNMTLEQAILETERIIGPYVDFPRIEDSSVSTNDDTRQVGEKSKRTRLPGSPDRAGDDALAGEPMAESQDDSDVSVLIDGNAAAAVYPVLPEVDLIDLNAHIAVIQGVDNPADRMSRQGGVAAATPYDWRDHTDVSGMYTADQEHEFQEFALDAAEQFEDAEEADATTGVVAAATPFATADSFGSVDEIGPPGGPIPATQEQHTSVGIEDKARAHVVADLRASLLAQLDELKGLEDQALVSSSSAVQSQRANTMGVRGHSMDPPMREDFGIDDQQPPIHNKIGPKLVRK